MSTARTTVAPDTEASEAVTTMQREGVGRLPVTDRTGALVGLVSRTDLLTVFRIVRPGGAPAAAEPAVGD